MSTHTTCPTCDHIFDGSCCPACGYTAKQAARERQYHRAPCDFCEAPWEAQWVDFAASGVRFVCRVHGDPVTWLPGIRPRYCYSEFSLIGTAREPGVHTHRLPLHTNGNTPRNDDQASTHRLL